MNTIDEAIAIVEAIFKPSHLTTVQELVLRQSWLGLNYEQMAESAGYDADYLRTVGSKLWQNLSDLVGERITKNNFRSVLRQYLAHGPVDTGTRADRPPEFPDSPGALDSPFYIERPPIEGRAKEVVLLPGSLLSIKAPQRMGKTSVLIRALNHAEKQGYRVARINLRQADSAVLQNLERFLRWLCFNLARQLQMEPHLDDYWDSELGSKVSCTCYVQDYLLVAADTPLVLGPDEVSHLFEYPEISREFLPMLRFWHEESKNLAIWQKLHLIISHSTDVYIPLNINQSPFNVGISLTLPEFQPSQVLDLSRRHGLNWSEAEVTQLMSMIGGHAYLVRLALYYLVHDHLDLEELLQKAPTQAGIYSEYLHSYLVNLRQHPELQAAFQAVLLAKAPIQIDTIAAYKLYRLGLVKLENDLVFPSCQLIRRYFRDRLTTD